MSNFLLNFKKTMIPFLWLILLTHIRWVNAADLANVQTSQVQNIFILAGQSNMSGRGGVINHAITWDGVIPPECKSNPNIFRLSAGLTWVKAQEPLHQDIDLSKVCGVGPGMSFANSVLKRDPNIGAIGLVPCAIGGTNISEWARGGVLYNHMIRRTEAALRGGGKLQALLWYQGESDTVALEDAKLYKFRLRRLFKNVLHDLHSPTLPVIQVALASSIGPYREQVRKTQLGINLPNVRTVDAKGLPVGMDYVHITTLAQVQLGQMLADAFLQTQTTQAVLLPIQLQISEIYSRDQDPTVYGCLNSFKSLKTIDGNRTKSTSSLLGIVHRSTKFPSVDDTQTSEKANIFTQQQHLLGYTLLKG